MAFSKRYVATLAVAALILYLARSIDYSSPAPQSRFGDNVADRPPYTAALVYLVSVLPGPRNPDQLLASLPLIQKNIPWRYQWPVLLLHAGAYETHESRMHFLDRLRESAQLQNLTPDATETLIKRIEFIPTSHELPVGIPEDGDSYGPIWDREWPGALSLNNKYPMFITCSAYHHVCAFFSYKIFNHPRIQDLTYYFRLDDDSHAREPACFDPFEYMHVHNKSYAFRREDPDMGWVTEGMWPFVSNYAQRHPKVESRLDRNGWEWPSGRFWPNNFGQAENFRSYETNFDLVKVSRFRTPEMTAFLDELASEPKRFYWYRWGMLQCSIETVEILTGMPGDAPVRLAQVYMFLDVAKEVHEMCEMPYAHKDYVWDDCDCIPLVQ